MKLRSAVNIAVEASTVWPLVADPEWHAAWNAKVRDVLRTTRGVVALGERFEMIYALTRDEELSEVEVVELQPGERVAYRHRVDDGRRERVVIERYELKPRRDGVTLTQTIDMSGAGIPWWLRPLIWLIHRFGETRGVDPLEELKKLAEPPEAKPAGG